MPYHHRLHVDLAPANAARESQECPKWAARGEASGDASGPGMLDETATTIRPVIICYTRSKRVNGKIICLCTSSDENLFT